MTKPKSKPLTKDRCSNCGRESELYSGIKGATIYNDLCNRCVGVLGSADFSRRYDRQYQRREYAKEIIQPWEKEEFIKSYPEEAREYGYTDSDFHKFG